MAITRPINVKENVFKKFLSYLEKVKQLNENQIFENIDISNSSNKLGVYNALTGYQDFNSIKEFLSVYFDNSNRVFILKFNNQEILKTPINKMYTDDILTAIKFIISLDSLENFDSNDIKKNFHEESFNLIKLSYLKKYFELNHDLFIKNISTFDLKGLFTNDDFAKFIVKDVLSSNKTYIEAFATCHTLIHISYSDLKELLENFFSINPPLSQIFFNLFKQNFTNEELSSIEDSFISGIELDISYGKNIYRSSIVIIDELSEEKVISLNDDKYSNILLYLIIINENMGNNYNNIINSFLKKGGLNEDEIKLIFACYNEDDKESLKIIANGNFSQTDKLTEILNIIDAPREIATAFHKKILVNSTFEKKSYNYNLLMYGPHIKNLSTVFLEVLANLLIEDKINITFKIENNNLICTLDHDEINMSELISQGNLSNIDLDAIAGDIYYLDDEDAINQDEDKTNNKRILPNFDLLNNGIPLKDKEVQAIKDYSFEGHENINMILHRNFASIASDELKKIDFKKEILSILFLASGLNKIQDSRMTNNLNKNSFRGESYVSIDELIFRDNNQDLIINMPGFISTSPEKSIAQKFAKYSLIEFSTLIGKDISSVTELNESEHLSLNSFVSYIKDPSDDSYYHAILFTPLIEENAQITEQEISLLSLFSKRNINMNRVNLSQWGNIISQSIPHSFLDAIDYVYQYLREPYSRSEDKIDLFLDTPFGLIHRPNHGLAHTLRVAMLIPRVIHDFGLNLSNEEILNLQLVSLFMVVGRENEIGFKDDQDLYNAYKSNSAELYKIYAKQFLNLNNEEIANYGSLLTSHDYYNTNIKTIADELLALTVSHNLDLIRCLNHYDLNIILNDFRLIFYKEKIMPLLNVAYEQIVQTGDRVIDYNEHQNYNFPLFYQCSTNPFKCLSEILKVNKCFNINDEGFKPK